MLFSAPMVQAILAGRKTQTRRVAKPRRFPSILHGQGPDGFPEERWDDSYILDPGNVDWLMAEAPAKAGETMYVREAFRFAKVYDGVKPAGVPNESTVFYEADGTPIPALRGGKLRPGIHMPRWCSRIEREIRDVRLERLNACTPEDAIAEGLMVENWTGWGDEPGTRGPPEPDVYKGWAGQPDWEESPVEAYRLLWEHINGPGSWAANPLVWVITFEGDRP